MNQIPPLSSYPLAIDDDYTLLLVYNTSEAALTEDSEPWGEEIVIEPAENNEIWGENGFANIDGELFYYDAVEKNDDDKIYKLKRCARNLAGTQTKFNAAGTMVRGFVVAEHHNTLVDAIVKVEKFIGYNFTDDEETLDWRIRNLREIPIIFDDFGCPDVNFTFNIISTNPSSGTLARYKVQVVGDFNQFTLNFGDGTSTVSLEEGEHQYAPNAKIDPFITLTNDRCTIVQTALARDSSDRPTADVAVQEFLFPVLPPVIIPTIPAFPNIDITTDVNFPPNLFPCLTFPNIGPISIPSVIIIEPSIDIPSFIGVGDLNIPSLITVIDDIPDIIITDSNVPDFIFVLDDVPDTVDVVDDIPDTIDISGDIDVVDDIPDSMVVVDDIPANIFVVSDIPDTITVNSNIPSNIPVTFPSPPCIPVCWGDPPTIPVVVTVACPSTSSASMTMTDMNMREMMATAGGGSFASPEDIEVSYDISGFPSEIMLKHDIPKEIELKSVKFEPLEFAELPSLKLETTTLKLETVGIPEKLVLEIPENFPRFIELSVPVEMPKLKIDASDVPTTLTVTGMPSTITIDPIQIELITPSFIPISYVGDAIPVSVSVQLELNYNKMLLDSVGGKPPCFAIIPCE